MSCYKFDYSICFVYLKSGTDLDKDSQLRQKIMDAKPTDTILESHMTTKQIELQVITTSTKSSSSNNVTEAVEYANSAPLVHRKTETSVAVPDLFAYVKKKMELNNSLVQEFEKIPSGLIYPADAARKPDNTKKNKYKAMYPYDHSRVIMRTLAGQPDSDYINACYIKGHCIEKAYIASQGPIDSSVQDFWRMIWEKGVHTVVMLTNIVEENKVKCIKYWSPISTAETFGLVTVFTEVEEVFAEYTIRRFRVTFEGKAKVRHREVTQFHYTVWPDKDVPRTSTSLLHFLNKVRFHDPRKLNTWLVHCSAGVGRTGTFIAIDILCDQGKEQGVVDIHQCVRDLREQRVNMVQTKGQYKYLHRLVVEALVLPSEPIPVETFHRTFDVLKADEKKNQKTRLLSEYEALRDETTSFLTEIKQKSNVSSDEDEDPYMAAKLPENKNKNRYDSILAPNEFRPFLALQVPGCTNYINAVYMPSYVDTHAFIVTQAPLQNTVTDMCRLVYEQEVNVVVSFEDNAKEEVGVCFPGSGTLTVGPFTIKLIQTEDKTSHTVRTYKMRYKSEEIIVYQMIFKFWPPSKIAPIEPHHVLSFVHDIETTRRHNGNKPVIVQCLNGAERSGLIVVLVNVLERAKYDKFVSIPQVIRQLRIRRQQIIPNFEQYKFCHEVLMCHIDNNTTYANI